MKLLVVFGATGQQGGSVVHSVLNDSELSAQYKIRAITRDPSNLASQSLQQKGVEVVKCDVDNMESLKNAMNGAHTVFTMNLAAGEPRPTKEMQIKEGKALSDTAVAVGAQYLIWSSISNVSRISGGKLLNVDFFDSKAEVEDYIRTLPIKSAFFAPGTFMQNYATQWRPRPAGDGTYAIMNVLKPSTRLPLIDPASDSGKFVGAILSRPEEYEGKFLSAAAEMMSMDEIVEVISKVEGKTVKFQQIPEEMFAKFLPPSDAKAYVEMMVFFRDYGYYGPQTEEAVERTIKQARGKLTTFEGFLTKTPLNLE